ncbi:MAG: T9SS type A sorting domain-containing protein [Bacteroidia bacterium]
MKSLLLSLCLLPLSLFSQTFKGESVEYDAVGNRYFTSDNGTSIVQRAVDGTISYFGQGLLADYGMEVVGNTLFAISGTKIYGYDLTSATQVAAITISGASFLNGLASDSASASLWVTDFTSGVISHVNISNLTAPVVTPIVPSFGGKPNGIVFDKANNRLVVVSWGASAAIKAIDLANNNALSTLTATTLTNIDGIDIDGQGNFYIASWSPDKIVKYNATFTQPLDITVNGLNNPADICYALQTDTLAIPNTGGNNILFVGFQATTQLTSSSLIHKTFSIFPNPISEKSSLTFQSEVVTKGSFSISDIKGSVLYLSPEFSTQIGENKLALPALALPQGFYYCQLMIDNEVVTTKFAVSE